jgi:hypothetical protein
LVARGRGEQSALPGEPASRAERGGGRGRGLLTARGQHGETAPRTPAHTARGIAHTAEGIGPGAHGRNEIRHPQNALHAMVMHGMHRQVLHGVLRT